MPLPRVCGSKRCAKRPSRMVCCQPNRSEFYMARIRDPMKWLSEFPENDAAATVALCTFF